MLSLESILSSIVSAPPGHGPRTTIGTIPNDYVSGLPHVIFDGEEVQSGKAYPYLLPYMPAANDRVLLMEAGHSWVVVGKIMLGAP